MANKELVKKLYADVYRHRKDLVRMTREKGLHIGGDMSCAEVLITLFNHTLNIDPKNPSWEDRDRFILSKGHGAGAMFIAMAKRGYFDLETVFQTYKTGFETPYGIHPCKRDLPCLDSSTGSLGHGLPIAAGIAAGAKMDGKKYRVFCLLGDGELDEGSNWEAAMAAHQFKLGNLIAIVDRNMFSLDGKTEELMALEPLADKWKAFGWNVIEINGNDLESVIDTFDNLPSSDTEIPTVVISHTVKSKGVDFLEGDATAHNTSFDDEKMKKALESLRKEYEEGLDK